MVVIKAAAEHLRTVSAGEEIPWEEVEKSINTLERRLGGAQEVVFEEAGPGEAHDGFQQPRDDVSFWTGVEDEENCPLGPDEDDYGPL